MRSKVQYIVWVVWMFSATIGLSQQARFIGIVMDAQTQEPLIGAQIIHSTNPWIGGVTNHNGEYVFACDSDSGTYWVLYMGYKTDTLKLFCNRYKKIGLHNVSVNIEGVVVSSEIERKPELAALPESSIKKADLDRHSSIKLGEALSTLDGVSFASMGSNIQLPVIHGLYGNRILILNNGFIQGFQNWGSDHAPEIDVSGADQIRVIKGSAGIKFGPEALGGAVIIESNPLKENKPLYGSLTSSYQTNGRGFGVNGSLGQGFHNWSYHVGGNMNQVGDRSAPDYLLTNTGFQEYAYQAGLHYRYKTWSIETHYSTINQNLAILRSAIGSSAASLIRNFEAPIPTYIRDFSYTIQEPNQRVNHTLSFVKMKKKLRRGDLQWRYARQWNGRKEWDVRRNAHLPVLDLELTTDEMQFEYNPKRNLRSTGSWGLQYFSQSNRNNPGTLVTPFIPNFSSSRWSAFGLEQIQLSKGKLEMGVRYDYDSRVVSGRTNRQEIFRDQFDFHNVTASVGYEMKLGKNLQVSHHLGSGWRPPNMHELYSFGQHEARTSFGLLRYQIENDRSISADRVTLFDLSNVKPENSIKYTSHWDWNTGRHRLNVTPYINLIYNYTFQRPIGVLSTARGPMPTFIVDQTDAMFIGSDLTYTYHYSPNGQLVAGGSYISSRDIRRNNYLINQPPVFIHLEWNHQFNNLPFFDMIECALKPHYTFRQFQAPRAISIRSLIDGTETLGFDDPIFDFLPPPQGYFLFNARITAVKNHWSVTLEGRNILNTSYRDYLNAMRYYADDLGVNLFFTLAYHFNN